MSARFDAGAGAWATPMLLNADADQPRVASDATGAVLAVYVVGGHLVRGRFFDPVSGTWQPEAAIEQNNTGTRWPSRRHCSKASCSSSPDKPSSPRSR